MLLIADAGPCFVGGSKVVVRILFESILFHDFIVSVYLIVDFQRFVSFISDGVQIQTCTDSALSWSKQI